MSSGTFAVVLIGILLLLLISIFLRQKNKDEADSRPQNVDFCELHSAEGLELPERVDGWLDLSGLTTVEGLKLPNHVGAGLDLKGLTTAEGLEFPEHMGGWLDLEGLTTSRGLKLPKRVGGDLDLKGLTTAEGLEFPEYVGGWLDLRGLTTSRGLKLPEHVSGDIYFGSLPKSKYDRLSHGPFRMDGKIRFEPLVDEDQIMRMRLRAARGGAVTRSTTRHMRAGMGSATSSPRIVLRRSPLDSRRAEPFPEL